MTKLKNFIAAILAKKFVVVALVLILALATGYSVGRIYVAGLDPVLKLNATEEELREDPQVVEKLVQRSKTQAPAAFSALEIYLVAEYNLCRTENFYKEMTGTVVAMGFVNQNMRSQKLRRGNTYVFNKLSPGSLSISNICSQVVYDKQTGQAKINNSGSFTLQDGFDIRANFAPEGFKEYSPEEYKKTFNTTPENVMPYIISSKTCAQNKFSPVKNNDDGTYSFSLAIDGASLEMAALCYSCDIKFSSSLPEPPQWISLNMDVTVDQNFNFVSVGYKEVYKMSYQFVKVNVTDTFVDMFYFDENDIPSVQQVAGREVL